MPVYGNRCPRDLDKWLRELGMQVRVRPLHEPTETHDGMPKHERRERRAGTDGKEDWRLNSDHPTDGDGGARPPRKSKKERDKNDLWDTPDDTTFDFSAAASLPKPPPSALLQLQPQQQQQRERERERERRDSRDFPKDDGDHKPRKERLPEKSTGQWKSGTPVPAAKIKSKTAAVPVSASASAVRKVDERFKHLLNVQSDATLDDLIDDGAGDQSGDRDQPEAHAASSTFKARAASTDSEKLPRLIDVLMEEPLSGSSTGPQATAVGDSEIGSGNLAGGLESFMKDALRSLTIEPAGMTTPPRAQRSSEPQQSGSRFLSWMQQPAGEPEATPERPVSGFDESTFVLGIEELIGEQPVTTPQQQQQQQQPMSKPTAMSVQSLFATMADANHAAAVAATATPVSVPSVHDIHAVLPPGATLGVNMHRPTPVATTALAAPAAQPAPAGSAGAVNLLEKLKFAEPAPQTPTKASPTQPTSNFTFHQQPTTAPRSSAKKPKRLVSAASRIVRTEQQTPGKASPADAAGAGAGGSSSPTPALQPSVTGTPETGVMRKTVPATTPVQPPVPVHVALQAAHASTAAGPAPSAGQPVPTTRPQRISVDQLLGAGFAGQPAQRSSAPRGGKA